MDIASLKSQYGERLEGLSGGPLSQAVAELVNFKCYVDSDGSVWHVGGIAQWWPHECRNALAEAERAWLVTDKRVQQYTLALLRLTEDKRSEGMACRMTYARLLAPDVCCRCLLLAAGEA